jgi:hypothetical protein
MVGAILAGKEVMDVEYFSVEGSSGVDRNVSSFEKISI